MTDPAKELGYVRLWRKSIDSEVFQDERLWRVWCWLLMKCTHKPRKSKGFDLRPGQYVSTVRFMAEDLRIPKSTMHDCIRRLKQMEMIKTSTGRMAGRTFTIISVCNWRLYAKSVSDPRTDPRTQPGRSPDDITTRTLRKGGSAADAATAPNTEDLTRQPWYGDYVNGLCDAAGIYRHKAERNRG